MNRVTIDDYKDTVPSVFSQHPSPKMTNRYKFANTYELCKEIENNGWNLFSVYSTKGNRRSVDENKSYLNHIVTFRKYSGSDFKVDDLIPTIYLSNSHNGSTSLRLQSGLHRVVCSNGLVTPMADFSSYTISHSSSKITQVKQFLENYMDVSKDLSTVVKHMTEYDLNDQDKEKFLKLALKVRFNTEKIVPEINTIEVLKPLRPQDEGSSLWSTFNIIQEKLSKGMFSFSKTPVDVGDISKYRKARNINNQFRYIDFNNKIWSIAKSKIETGDFQLA